MRRLNRRGFLATLLNAFLVACGGGGGGGSAAGPSAAPATAATPPTGQAGSSGSSGGGADAVSPPDPPPSEPPPATGNVVQRENSKTAAQGVTSAWEIPDASYAANREIEGFASATSVNRGGSIELFVNTTDPTYTISVYRIGWYGGKGGRLVAGPISRAGIVQPNPSFDSVNRLVQCDWHDPYVLNIPDNRADPTDWASGFYLAKLTGSSGKQSYIVFVVRDDGRQSDLLFQGSVTTYAAYNNWGGYSFYEVNSVGGKHAFKLSFDRPYNNPQRARNGKGAGDFLGWEIHALRFMEREGYDATYATNIDTHVNGASLLRHKAFLSVGHDEYWTKAMYDAQEVARDRGINLAYFGSNTGYWQVRLEPSGITSQANRTVVCYKYETPNSDPLYLTNPSLSTHLWRKENNPAIRRPEAALVGIMYDYNSVDLDMVMAAAPAWILAGTALRAGSVLRGLLGYEVDRVDASSPAGLQIVASSPYTVTLPDGRREVRQAASSFYTASSGAGVFAAGSMQWNWGLDAYPPFADRVNPAVQQMTRNIVNRFVGRSA